MFTDSKQAGETVAKLKEDGQADQISLVARNEDGEVQEHQVKQDVSKGAKASASAGSVAGGLVGLIAGAATAKILAKCYS